MSSLLPFGTAGQWFKGSLHTHTTQSDGKLPPAENMQWHADHGYDFLGLTDHNRVTDPRAFIAKLPLLAIPSVEISARRGEVEYHVVTLGVRSMPIARNQDPQATIDATNAAGGLCFIAHPYWHDHTLDDSHFAYPDHGRGWVMVRAERLDGPTILDALRQGLFYSTMGPEIHDVQIEGRQITVHCSPARSIFLVGDIYYCPHAAQAWDGRPLTEATFTLRPQQRYLRVEVVDMNGQSAWTNAYFVE